MIRARRQMLARRLVLMGVVLALPLAFPAAVALQPVGNLVQNPGAEAGAASPDGNTVVPIPGWTTTSNFTVVRYGAAGFPDAADSASISGGSNFFAGGPNTALSSATQAVVVADYFREIDTGNLTATLSASIGGSGDQEDNGTVDAVFVNGFGIELGRITIGPVTAADRGFETKLLPRSASAPIPAGTRSIRVVMTATRTIGVYNNAFFDNLSLTIAGPGGSLTPIPGPQGCIARDGAGGACATYAPLDGASGLALSPDGRHLYVTSYVSDSLALIDRDPETGKLSQRPGTCWNRTGADGCRQARALNGASDVAVSRDGKNVYVASAVSDGVAIFRRNAVGRLTQLEGKKGCITDEGAGGRCINGKATDGATSIVVSSPGTNVYVGASRALAIFKRNLAGELAHLPGKKGCFRARFRQRDRGCTKIVYGNFTGTGSVAISPDGLNVYDKGHLPNSFKRAPATGELTYLGNFIGPSSETGAGQEGPRAVLVSPDRKNVYIAAGRGIAAFARGDSSEKPVQLDDTLGCVGISAPPCSAGPAAYALAISPNGENVYSAAGSGNGPAGQPLPPFFLQVYARSPIQGGLTAMTGPGTCIAHDVSPYPYCTAVPAIRRPSAIAVSTDGRHVYVTDELADSVVAFVRQS